jgi:hypothetical protein|tara:strand:- start:40 stop:462 length:423 start_codon:yes stop_codon:yes gene_type:complete
MSRVNFDVAQTLDIICVKGDTFSLDLTLKDSSGTAIDITNYVFYTQVFDGSKLLISTTDSKDSGLQRVSDGNIVVTKNADQTTNTGKFNISITSAVMSNIPAGGYRYETQMSTTGDATGVDTTILKGSFVVNQDLAQPSR